MSLKNKRQRAVVAIYIDPDYYPPTINAILNIADEYDEVIVISRNNSVRDFEYPANVVLKKVGKLSTVRAMETQPLWQKIGYFLRFTITLLQHSGNKKCNLLLLYDSFALFAYSLIRPGLAKKIIWYHNHDMPDRNGVNKWSIGGLAARYEEKGMKTISCFSLPAEERLLYYPKLSKSIPVFILPNFPSLKVYSTNTEKSVQDHTLRIIFQGFVGAGHSLEEVVQLLPLTINDYSLQLIIKGSVKPAYQAQLTALAERLGVKEKLIWHGIGPYSELPALTSTCSVGIGINMNQDIVSRTQGTASNKIYEYAASGLAVLLYDSEQFRQYLQQYAWAFFTDGTVASLQTELEKIAGNLPQCCRLARASFEAELNFEHQFIPAFKQIMAIEK